MTHDEIGRSLLAAFAQVPDRRSVHGRRHPLPALLALTTAAMLSGARSLYVLAQGGRLQAPEVVRAHWRSANTVHAVRDVTLGEAASTVRSGSAPRVLAAVRTVVLGVLHRRRWRTIAAALRHDAWRPAAHVLRLLGMHRSG